MRLPKSLTGCGAAVLCSLLAACASGGNDGDLGDSGVDTGAPGHDATTATDTGSDSTVIISLDGSAPDAADAPSSDAPADQAAGDGASVSDGSGDSPASSDALADAPTDGAADGAGDAEGDALIDGALDGAGDGANDGANDAAGDAPIDAAHDAPVDTGSATATFSTGCGGAHTLVSGVVVAPNGTDPIPNVRVYAAESINPYPTNYCDKCAAPIDPAYAATITAADGTFSLNLDNVPTSATIDLAIQIGRFRKHTTLAVSACQTETPPAADLTLPGSSAAGDIPKIAVSSGNVDHLDVVLNNLGITEFDCYEGRKTIPFTSTTTCNEGTAVTSGKTIADVIEAATSLDAYNMAFLSCAPGAYSTFAATHSTATMNTNTQSWVAGGGRIFVTDTAYDYIAQAFPSGATWAGPAAPAAGQPQPVDGANIGCAPGSSSTAHAALYPATVDDPFLAQWLSAIGFLPKPVPSPAAVQIQGYYEPWSTIASLPVSSSLIVDGTMPIDPTYSTTACGAPTQTDVPLTTEFDVPSCGRVVFSSFHTYTGTGVSASAANEKIMEYLIFAAAVCSG